MEEMHIDNLPELGTKAAAVAGIESMLYAAIRLREPFSPVQLRYWLDAYYQARRAQEIEERADWRSFAAFCADLIPKVQSGPMKASAPTEEAEWAPQKYEVIKIRAEDLEEARPVTEIIRDEIRRAAKAAGIEIKEETAEPPHQSPAATASPQGEAKREEDDGADVSAPP